MDLLLNKNINYASYISANFQPGGGEVQLSKTFDYVKSNGLLVSKLDYWNPFKNGAIDLIHLFSVCASTEILVNMLIKLNIKYVVSPILWPTDYICDSEHHRIKHILRNSELILPNSQAEKQIISQNFSIPLSKFHVVSNGIDFKKYRSVERIADNIDQDYIVTIANIDRRKNIRRVVKVLKELGYKLHLYGEVRDENYFSELMNDFSCTIRYHGFIENGSDFHLKILEKARLLILASEYETPGLVLLEAGAAGVPIVATEVGATKEYLSNFVSYCNPSSDLSIRSAIVAALESAAVLSPSARNYFGEFDWNNTAKQTIEAYIKIFSSQKTIDASDFYSNVGIVVNKSRVADESHSDGEGYLLYGPYITFHQGDYIIKLDYSSSENSSVVVGTFEVCDSNADIVINSKKIYGTNGNVACLNLSLSLFESLIDIVEFRVHWNSIGILVVNSISYGKV